MKVNLQYKNGSSYVLIPKAFREIMELNDKAEMEFVNNQIIIKQIKDEKEKQEA